MADLQLIPHTKRKKMTKARAAKIFLAHNGICVNCGQQIRQGDGWFVEHRVPLAQGGADDDTNTAPAHTKCKPQKDATDAAGKAKRDRIVTKTWTRPDARKSALAGPDVKYSRARGCLVDRRTGEPVEEQSQ